MTILIPQNHGLDLHSWRCVGFAMGTHHDAELARAALCVAVAIRGGAVAGVRSHRPGRRVRRQPVRDRMPQRRGHLVHGTHGLVGNTVAESFKSALEFELLSRHHFATREQARRGAGTFIDKYDTGTGIPPTACSAQSTTKANTQYNVPPSARTDTQRKERCVNRVEAASSPLSARFDAAPGHGPGSSGIKSRCAIAQRRACGPPFTSELRRPLPTLRHGQGAGRCPAGRAAPSTKNQDQVPTTKSLRLQGIARILKRLASCVVDLPTSSSGVLGPGEGFGAFVVAVDVGADTGPQVGDVGEGAQRMAWRVMMPKKISTMFSHEQLVGVNADVAARCRT